MPNPLTPATTIAQVLPRTGGHVELRFYEVSGRPVRTLADARLPAGRHLIHGQFSSCRRLPAHPRPAPNKTVNPSEHLKRGLSGAAHSWPASDSCGPDRTGCGRGMHSVADRGHENRHGRLQLGDSRDHPACRRGRAMETEVGIEPTSTRFAGGWHHRFEVCAAHQHGLSVRSIVRPAEPQHKSCGPHSARQPVEYPQAARPPQLCAGAPAFQPESASTSAP